MLHPAFPIETERLWLRPYEDGDAEALYAIQRRPDVTRFSTGNRAPGPTCAA